MDEFDSEDLYEIENADALNKMDILKTETAKDRFINEIKNGLGKQIKENPSKVEIIENPKKSFGARCKEGIIKFFKRF